jgi:hypothetical protein
VRPAGCRLRRRSLGDMAVIIVSAAAIQANTTLIHTIQAHTDDTYDTVIYIQYSVLQTHTYNDQPAKNNFLDLGARVLKKSFLPE